MIDGICARFCEKQPGIFLLPLPAVGAMGVTWGRGEAPWFWLKNGACYGIVVLLKGGRGMTKHILAQDVAEILLTEEQIAVKIAELGERISKDYAGKDLLAIGILKGAILFMSDLIRKITIPVKTDFVAVSSYGASTRSSGIVRILKDLDESVEGKHLLIVEDIVDTGLTLKYLVENLSSRRPASIKVCTLMDKPARREVQIVPDYTGFQIPDKFVVGFGLDYAERYRNLPFIGVLKPEIYTK